MKPELYSIGSMGSLHSGYALRYDKQVVASHPSPVYLGVLLQALLQGAEHDDAHLIAKTVHARGWPSYEERMQHFKTTGPWTPARHPFASREMGVTACAAPSASSAPAPPSSSRLPSS